MNIGNLAFQKHLVECYNETMSRHYRLPVFTDEILSQIIWGMENQDADYYLNIKDGSVYSREFGGDDVEVPDEYLVELPPWGSSDGYQLMVSFVNVCKNHKLKEKLLRELSGRSHGVFRRFRDVLASDSESLQQWYEFKDHKMKAHIKAWYRANFGSQKTTDESEDGLGLGELLADFEIVHLESLDNYCEDLMQNYVGSNAIAAKTLEGFQDRQAFEVVKGETPCGAIIYENVGDKCCILYYYIEESHRELGLFSLMFDLLNRELERQQIQGVIMPFTAQSAFFKNSIIGHEVALDPSVDYLEYSLKQWNGNLESSEFAYLL